MHLIAGLNLTIKDQSKKFWYGIDDGISMAEYEKELRNKGEYRDLGEYGWWGNFR